MKERNGLDRRGAWSLGQVKRKEFPDSMGSSIGMGTGDSEPPVFNCLDFTLDSSRWMGSR